MENNIDKQYQTLLQTILDFGVEKKDRTGTGTKSIFGYNLRFTDVENNFPIITTKKMPFKTIVTELLWFLRGDTNIQYLVQNGCNIWNGDAYKNYTKKLSEKHSKYYEPLSMEKFIERIKTDEAFANKWGDLGPIYGNQWRDCGGKIDTQLSNTKGEDGFYEYITNHIPGIDQIQNLISELKTNPDSRRLMVNAWNVNELDNMVLPPCHYGFQLYTRELSKGERMDYWFKNNKPNRDVCDSVDESSEEEQHKYFDDANVPKRALSLMWNQRSVDTFLGLPFNITSYALLLRIIAKEVDMIADDLIANLGDTHLYLNHIEQAKEQISREPMQLPTLKIENEVIWKEGDCLPTYSVEHFTLENYQSHPTIKAPLSN